MNMNYAQVRPNGALSLASKLGVYATMGFLGTYSFNASGLDLGAMLNDPASVDWRLVGGSLERLSETAAVDIKAFVDGPVSDLVAGFSGAAGIDGMDFSQADTLGDVATEIMELPVLRVAFVR